MFGISPCEAFSQFVFLKQQNKKARQAGSMASHGLFLEKTEGEVMELMLLFPLLLYIFTPFLCKR
jgi:hypothetical protein